MLVTTNECLIFLKYLQSVVFRARLGYDGLSHIAVVPPPPDMQPEVDSTAKQVAQQPNPDVFEEELRQKQISAASPENVLGANETHNIQRFLWVQNELCLDQIIAF